jgi:hypothetical protein
VEDGNGHHLRPLASDRVGAKTQLRSGGSERGMETPMVAGSQIANPMVDLHQVVGSGCNSPGHQQPRYERSYLRR